MTTHRNPDVYVEETSAVPPSVTEVGTAIPAFIGYTEKAADPANGRNLLMVPTRVRSMKEYQNAFGSASSETIAITVNEDAATHVLSVGSMSVPAPSFLLYYAVRLFFDNGGSQCYIVSAGSYGDGSRAIPAAPGDCRRAERGCAGGRADADRHSRGGEARRRGLLALVQARPASVRQRSGTDSASSTSQAAPLSTRRARRERAASSAPITSRYGAAYYPFLRTTLNHWPSTRARPTSTSRSTAPAGGRPGPPFGPRKTDGLQRRQGAR